MTCETYQKSLSHGQLLKMERVKNMKIGINTITFGKETPEERLRLSKEAGFQGVEILAYPQELTQNGIKDAMSLLRRLDLEVIMIACGPPIASSQGELCLESSNETIRNNTIRYVKRCVDWAHQFQTDKVYVITPTEKSKITDTARSLKLLRDSLKTCCDYARSVGVKICIEHAPGKLVGELAHLNQLMKEFEIENLGVLVDMGHLNITKENTPDIIMNTDKILHVHIDNNDGKNDLHMPLGMGTMQRSDIADFLKTLKRKKYEGYYSIEFLNLQDPLRTLKEDINLMRDIYQGV